MKHLILWGSLLIMAVLALVLWEKTTVTTIWDHNTSPLYIDIIFFLLGLNLAVARGISLFRKVFRS